MTIAEKPMWPYARSALIGALLGSIFGFAGAWNAAAEAGGTVTDQPLLNLVGLSSAIGIVAGLVFWRLRALRSRGRLWYIISWIIAVSTATILIVIPDSMRTGRWTDLLFAAFLGAGAGLGLGLFAYDLFGSKGT